MVEEEECDGVGGEVSQTDVDGATLYYEQLV
jgi:hypothetical protein